MASNLVIHPRRCRVTLWRSSWSIENGITPEAELCEVTDLNTTFSLNQIPMAAVGIPVGTRLSDGKTAAIEVIDKMVRDKAPISVKIEWADEPMHATTSKTNKEETDFEWPKDGCFVFKGYAAALGFEKTSKSVSLQLHIQHWLNDLAVVSPYSPRMHCSCPDAFGIYLNSISGGDPNVGVLPMRDWSYVDTSISQAEGTDESVWPILVSIFNAILEKSLEVNQSAIGAASQIYIDKMHGAMNHIEGHIPWHKDILEDIGTINQPMLLGIGSEAAKTWMNTTIWDAISNMYAGMFFFAISPAVDKAYIIPMPNSISENHIDLEANDLFSVSISVPTNPVLGGCCLAYQNDTNNEFGASDFTIGPLHPPVDEGMLEESVGGPIVITSMPQWLQVQDILSQITDQYMLCNPHEGELEDKEGMEEAAEDKQEMKSAVDVIAKQLVEFDFTSKVFSGRSATCSMPFNAKITPGSCVHIFIKPVVTKEVPIELYGVVTGVTVQVAHGHASTQLSLTNLRSSGEFNSEIYNPGPIFYDEIWSGVDVPLYSLK